MNYKFNNKSITVEEAKIKLEQFCIYQDRCHFEVAQKLNSLNLIQEAKDLIFIDLIQNNFLNEERFAKSFTRGKFYLKKWGKIKIVNALKYKKISSKNIEISLIEIDDSDYIKTIKTLATKKTDSIRENNKFKKKQKVINYLLQKGYEFNIVIDTLNDLL